MLFAVILSPCSAQAPGDGDERCRDDEDAPTYADNEKTLMDSYHYLQLLPGNGSGNIIPGAVWNDRSVDGNDDDDNTINPTYVRYLCKIFEKLLSSLFCNSSGSKVLEEYVGFRFEFVGGKGLEQLRTTGSSLNTLTGTSAILDTTTQWK